MRSPCLEPRCRLNRGAGRAGRISADGGAPETMPRARYTYKDKERQPTVNTYYELDRRGR